MLSKIKGVIKSIIEFVADVAKRMLPVIILLLIPFTLCVLSILIIDFLPPSFLARTLSYFLMVFAIIGLVCVIHLLNNVDNWE